MDDWRLNGQEEYLLGKHLNHTAFISSETSDHEHCEFYFCKLGHGQESGVFPIVPTMGITGYARNATTILKTASFGSRTTGMYNNYCARSAGESPQTAAVSPLKRYIKSYSNTGGLSFDSPPVSVSKKSAK
ncbi:MAG: hypothetical protein J6K00_02265 [Oscillospiraceae bacterium]|nr:hypothetical protein [Oscillospiraceae bacterium]